VLQDPQKEAACNQRATQNYLAFFQFHSLSPVNAILPHERVAVLLVLLLEGRYHGQQCFD
jgi:hypothetical protein